jgi:hypothetical protein
MAAAHSLGAAYPVELESDKFALLCFKLYLFLSHGKLYKKGQYREPGAIADDKATTVSRHANPTAPGRDYQLLNGGPSSYS